jgi:hypothetical protein
VFLSFVLLMSSAIASVLIVMAMVRAINRKRGRTDRLRLMNSSWKMVAREYRAAYPEGGLSRALVVAIWLTGLLALAAVYLVITVLPKYAFPAK